MSSKLENLQLMYWAAKADLDRARVKAKARMYPGEVGHYRQRIEQIRGWIEREIARQRAGTQRPSDSIQVHNMAAEE